MTSVWPDLEPILAKVQKPARYIGGEDGAGAKPPAPGLVSWLFMYPDAYEIGLPNQGLQILYEIANERADTRADRAYCPWIDLEAEMWARSIPLFSVEHHRRLASSTSSASTCRPNSPTPTCSTRSTSLRCRCARPSGRSTIR
ncbi:MAG: hypothetical protein R2710_22220 [Acidimicrobiales bacterium]